MEITRVGSFEEIGASRWNALVQDSERSSVFQIFEYQRTWWKHFGEGHPGRELFLLLAADGDSLIGIAPLMIERGLGRVGPTIRFIGTPICDFMDFILAKGSEREVLQGFLSNLAQAKVMEIDLLFILEGSHTLNAPSLKSVSIERSPYIALGKDWDSTYRSLNGTIRRYTARRERAIARTGRIQYGRVQRKEEIRGFLEEYFKIHVAKWRDFEGRYSQFQQEQWKNFVREICDLFFSGPHLDLSYLKMDSEMIACHFGFVYKKVFYWYMPAYNPRYSRFSPGHLLILRLLRHCCENDISSFDFLRGEEPYKLMWTLTSRELFCCLGYSDYFLLNKTGRAMKVMKDFYTGKIKNRIKKVAPVMHVWHKMKQKDLI